MTKLCFDFPSTEQFVHASFCSNGKDVSGEDKLVFLVLIYSIKFYATLET